MKQNQKSSLQQKLKRFFRDHKRSRREAAFQNLLAACLLFILTFVTVRGYAAGHTVEKAAEEWCRSNMFGEGEICAARTYETEGIQYKDVIVSKRAGDGRRYEARVILQQENPLKWISCGSAWSSEPIPEKLQTDGLTIADGTRILEGANMVFLPTEAVSGLFMEFDQACGASVERRDWGTLLSVAIHFSEEHQHSIDRGVYFLVDLDTREVVSSVFKPVTIDGVTYEYWLSEERMIFIAEKIKEAIS